MIFETIPMVLVFVALILSILEAISVDKRLARTKSVAEENKRLAEWKRAQDMSTRNVEQEIQKVGSQSERLESELNNKIEEAKSKENEIKTLNEQLVRFANKEKEREKTISGEESRIPSGGKEPAEVSAELERLKSALDEKTRELSSKENQIKGLNDELARLNTQQKEFQYRIAELKKFESDLLWLEKVLNEQEETSGEIKQRVEENRGKMQLLNEKAKENVELIASFAEGKEFDEFRKSIHLDEIIQKYERELGTLRGKNVELKKKLGLDKYLETKAAN